MSENMLRRVATNIVTAGQLLCVSCQGIFVGTDDMEDFYNFCKRFLPVFETAVARYAGHVDIGILAQTSLQRYSSKHETAFTEPRVFSGQYFCLIACADRTIEPAIGFVNAWVMPLP